VKASELLELSYPASENAVSRATRRRVTAGWSIVCEGGRRTGQTNTRRKRRVLGRLREEVRGLRSNVGGGVPEGRESIEVAVETLPAVASGGRAVAEVSPPLGLIDSVEQEGVLWRTGADGRFPSRLVRRTA